MNAPTAIGSRADPSFLSLDGKTTIAVRYATHPDAAKSFDTAELRRHYLVESLFRPDMVSLTYSHVDRIVVGGAMPAAASLALQALKPIGTASFLDRRELGLINVGGPGRVSVDGTTYAIGQRDSLYVGMGGGEVWFESEHAGDPARFYLLSAPAHARCETRKIAPADAKKLALGAREAANVRTIHQTVHPEVCRSSQLSMGFTVLEPGSVWNTMPPHRHDRRCEIYFYFDLAPDARVIHLMGEPQETRHLVVANEQAVISPGWSMHSGAGTSNYAFVWAMAGDNQDYTDMDAIAMSDLR